MAAIMRISEEWMSSNATAASDEHAMLDYLMGVQEKNGGEAFLSGEALLSNELQLSEDTRFCVAGSIRPITQYIGEGPVQCVIFTVARERMQQVHALLHARDNADSDDATTDDGPLVSVASETNSTDSDSLEPFQLCMEVTDAHKYLVSSPSPNRPVIN
eukprot:gene3186-13199_t